MLSHVTIGTNDLARAIRFYDAVLAPLGIARGTSPWETWAMWYSAHVRDPDGNQIHFV